MAESHKAPDPQEAMLGDLSAALLVVVQQHVLGERWHINRSDILSAFRQTLQAYGVRVSASACVDQTMEELRQTIEKWEPSL